MPAASPSWESPFGVILGGDGNIWVGDDNSVNVGKVTTGATISTYQAGHVFTNFLAPGLDGLTWFSECSTDALSSVTTSGTITQVTPPGGGNIQGVALGPDGNIWFTDIATRHIGTVISGVPSEFSASTFTNQPSTAEDIVAGSDGSLWVAEGNLIAQVSTSGTIMNQFSGAGAIGQGNFITAGPDGALWFTDTSNNAIGRITTSGAITEYPLPTGNALPNGITVGPDGNLWFTEGAVHNIGVLKL
jgi:virginiamycin B lyase